MKRLRPFDYYEPHSVAEASAIVTEVGTGASLLAGGTDLIVDMKVGRLQPAAVVNLKRISGLSGVELRDEGTWIGALTSVADLERSERLWNLHTALAEAASRLASPSVRVLATIGGNVGRASPASDLGPALIVLGAKVAITGPSGSREELVEDLYVGPGQTTLDAADIITAFTLPSPPARYGSAHLKLGKRHTGTDIAVVGASASVELDPEGQVADCRIALASVAPRIVRATDAEQGLIGLRPGESAVAAAAETAAQVARPIDDLRSSAEYRMRIVAVLARRVVTEAVVRAGTEGAADA